MTLKMDMTQTANKIEIRITRYNSTRLRVMLAALLLNLAGAIAPMRVTIDHPYINQLLELCPFCGGLASGPERSGVPSDLRCQRCGLQVVVSEGKVIHDLPCEFECHVASGMGFVPEAGCPIHDGDCS